MQFRTLIRARTPRSDCPEHGVKTIQVPWAAPQGRFTLLFERFAVEVLLASASVSQACELLGISWDTAQLGLASQDVWPCCWIENGGFDEKWGSAATDLPGSRASAVRLVLATDTIIWRSTELRRSMLVSIEDGWPKIGGFVVVMFNDYFERLVVDHAATRVGFKSPRSSRSASCL